MGKSGGRCKCCTPVVTIATFVVFGVLLVCLGAGSIPFLSKFYKDTVKKQLVLENNSNGGNEAYKNWISPPTIVYMQFYVFNYTNFLDVINNKAKPKVVQLGPYSYKEIRVNEVLDQDEYEITYLQNNTFIFDETTSCVNCSENDVIYTPNLAVMTVLSKLKGLGITDKSPGIQRLGMRLLDTTLNLEPTYTMFMPLTVYKVLWGYDSPFIANIDKLIDKIEGYLPEFIKKLIPDLKVNPFVSLQQNGTAGALANGNMTILTGKRNIDKVMETTKWRGENSTGLWNGNTFTNFWHGKYGNMINGTDGSRFKPFLEKNEEIYIFVSQLCRSLYLKYEEDTSIFDIPLYQFSTTPELFENHTGNPDNAAFCDPKGVCYGSGLLPVGQCQTGNPPAFMSSPHFYQGYPGLWEAIDGLNPQKKLHQTYLSVEPTTGIVMDAHKRLQININAQKVPFITKPNCFASDSNMLPVLYIHEFSTIDEPNAQKFKDEVMKPKTYIKAGEYGLIGLGGLLFIISLILGARYQRKKNREETKYEKFEEPNTIQEPVST